MTKIIGQPEASCALCGKTWLESLMVRAKSGRTFHPSCVIEFAAEMADKAISNREKNAEKNTGEDVPETAVPQP
jgi:hypothetical protein